MLSGATNRGTLMATTLLRGGFALGLLCSAAVWAQDDEKGPAGNLPATTVQLPTFGISIDAEGPLNARTLRDFDGRLLAERLAAARAAKPGDVWAASKLRKISLVRL